MTNHKKPFNNLIHNIPVLGIVTFTILVIYSSTLYPGGFSANLNSEGFDWFNNYWCHLANTKAINGQENPARPFAISAMLILSFSLAIFFIQFAEVYPENIYWKRTIKFSGILSMLFASLVFTPYHDSVILVSSFFGLFVTIGIIRAIYKTSLSYYKTSGLFCLLLLALNNYIYYSNQGIQHLPLIQKITFLIVLGWIVGLNLELGKKRQQVASS